ncbi:MAG: response regulator [Gammaproteobacteria bacterium]|nr:MAG: response regulator [Gammaproteobacteria bacterium]
MATILIVDDSPTDIHVLKTMLERHGYHTITASSGEEGIQVARQSRPDVILMDIVMPGMSGFQAIRQLGQDPETRSIPVIVVSTKDMETDKIWAMRQGAKDYLTKPVSEKQLIDTIHAALGLP